MWLWNQTSDEVGAALSRATSKFVPHRSHSFVVWADPQLDRLEVDLFRVACGQQVTAVEQLLGGQFRPWWWLTPRLQVYLFRDSDAVSNVYGGPAEGFAIFTNGRIVVNLEANWIPLLRHELAHIIGGDWNPHAPDFLTEGLAVWVEGSTHGRPTPDVARECLFHLDVLPILLSPRPKSAWGKYRYYAYAGSFTTTLIECFGLPRFKRFYCDRGLTDRNFAQRFERHFPISLPATVQIWIQSLAGPGVARMLTPRFLKADL